MSTSLPAAWTALMGVIAGALPTVQVIDGEIGEYLAFDYVQIIDAAGEDTPATMGRPLRMNERYAFSCLARAYAGDSDMPARRARAAAMYRAVRDALQTDPSMGGVINGRARATGYRLTVGPTEKGGSAAHIEFAVDVTNQTLD